MKSPISNDNVFVASTARPIAPNAPLSSSLPHRNHHHHHHRGHGNNKRRIDPINNHNNANANANADAAAVLSASIPLPKSHIHRTPSELQLADDTRRAEYEDVRMYARLVVGMQSRCVASGYVHPLTKKSLVDILRTKQADESELFAYHEEEEQDHDDNDDDGWSFSYDDRDQQQQEQQDDNDSVDTPLPAHPMGTSSRAPTVVKTPSCGSIASEGVSMSPCSSPPPAPERQENDDNYDDECVFSMEL